MITLYQYNDMTFIGIKVGMTCSGAFFTPPCLSIVQLQDALFASPLAVTARATLSVFRAKCEDSFHVSCQVPWAE